MVKTHDTKIKPQPPNQHPKLQNNSHTQDPRYSCFKIISIHRIHDTFLQDLNPKKKKKKPNLQDLTHAKRLAMPTPNCHYKVAAPKGRIGGAQLREERLRERKDIGSDEKRKKKREEKILVKSDTPQPAITHVNQKSRQKLDGGIKFLPSKNLRDWNCTL